MGKKRSALTGQLAGAFFLKHDRLNARPQVYNVRAIARKLVRYQDLKMTSRSDRRKFLSKITAAGRVSGSASRVFSLRNRNLSSSSPSPPALNTTW